MSPEPTDFQKTRKPAALLAQPQNSLLKTLSSITKSYGWKPLEVGRGIHAWKYLQKSKVDVVVAHWELPEINGLGLLSLIRGHHAHGDTPVVLVGDQLSKSDVLDAGRNGVNDIWLMPLSTEDLTEKMKNLFFAKDDQMVVEAKRMYQKGETLMKEGRLHEALDTFQKIVESFEQAEIYYNLGYIKTAQNRYPEAINYFRKATELNKAFAQAYQKMGECYEKMGQNDLAGKCFETAAETFLEQDMDEEAEEMINQVVALNPDTTNIYNTLGIAYRKRKDYVKADALYQKALKVAPNDENIHYNLARVRFDAGDFARTVEPLSQAIRINPEFGAAKDLLMMIKQKLGK